MESIYPVKIDGFSEASEIRQYFKGLTVFVTGATGFLGTLLVEKLLRSCPDIKRIYILIRPKKNHSIEERLHQYFHETVFNLIRSKNPEALKKVKPLLGEFSLPNLGLSIENRHIITSEVNCILHLAATVRFDEKLQDAAYINIRSVRDLLQLAKEVRNLSSIVHVSTAFSNCLKKHIDEVFYKPPISASQLLLLTEALSEDRLKEITPILLGEWPNTYSFTKCVAEDVIRTESENLPISIVRPSIVVGTASEPISGWINNYYGAAGVVAATGVGIIHCLQCKGNYVADIIPADYVINNVIASAWSTAQNRNKAIGINQETSKISNQIPIYNCVSYAQNPISWGRFNDLSFKYGRKSPSVFLVWYPFLFLIPNRYLQFIVHLALHIIPAYIADTIAVCIGKNPSFIKSYQKISKFINALSYFSTREWHFTTKNNIDLWKKLNAADQKEFYFNIENLDWNLYINDFVEGVRIYLMKDPLESQSRGRKKYKILKYVHYFIVLILLLSFTYLCTYTFI